MLIAFTGLKGSGKDAAADVLVQRFAFRNVKMADPLKDMLRTMYHRAGYAADLIEQKIEGNMKEHPCSLLGGQTPRHAMQTLGTEWRNMIDRDLWLRIWAARVDTLRFAGNDVVCTDIRFKHEAAMLRDLGGKLVRIRRPGVEPTDLHISEQEMLELEVNAEIINDGTLAQLHEKVIQLL